MQMLKFDVGGFIMLWVILVLMLIGICRIIILLQDIKELLEKQNEKLDKK